MFEKGQTVALVDARGGQGIAVRCDHTDDDAVRALFERIRDAHGRVDILVNNVWGGYAGWHERRVPEMLARSGTSRSTSGTRR